jgi:2-C-methyl-D-erythritol 4-phosphate cytidylyltransferase/2-C-methyl-D-erythritol 2,4-cyclodiphosphate synthase
MSQYPTSAIIVAAGRGLRFDKGLGTYPKQLQLLGGRPLITWTLKAFLELPGGVEVILVVPKDFYSDFVQIAEPYGRIKVVVGGENRVDSTKCGLAAVCAEAKVVLVHDGVRPLVCREHIEKVRLAAIEHRAAILALPVVDTIKREDGDGFISQTVSRKNLWQAQTPQGFAKDLLNEALSTVDDAQVSDEAALVEAMGVKVKLVPGSFSNLKITGPGDLVIAQSLVKQHLADQGCANEPKNVHDTDFSDISDISDISGKSGPLKPKAHEIRVGQGWDFHRFDSERPLWLGCIFIPQERGLSGHSDADVLAHALIDALLGASGLGDIGQWFDPKQERWKGAPGAELLNIAYHKVKQQGWFLVNADLTLLGPKPKISQYRQKMIWAISQALGESEGKFNLKGKTTEGLGFIGREEGLAATATVLLQA